MTGAGRLPQRGKAEILYVLILHHHLLCSVFSGHATVLCLSNPKLQVTQTSYNRSFPLPPFLLQPYSF